MLTFIFGVITGVVAAVPLKAAYVKFKPVIMAQINKLK